MVLFQVSTHFQLICAINVKIQLLPNIEADLHLDDTSDFSWIMEKLHKSGLFCNIEISKQVQESIKIRKEMISRKSLILKQIPDIWKFKNECQYTDIYFGHDMIPNKWYYYHLVEKGIFPKIHILDEGMSTYFKDLYTVAKYDLLDHKKYGKNSYFNKIKEQMLFLPEGYMLKNVSWPVTCIPKVNEKVKDILNKIYSPRRMRVPKEKYIYLAAGGYEEGFYHNELDLVNQIAKLIGKENIVIKQHPRHKLDIFSNFGYKVWNDESGMPWEILLLNNDTSAQVYLTLFSNAALSPIIMLGRSQYTVYLYNLFLGSDRHGLFGKNAEISFVYLDKIKTIINKEQKYIFVPKTEEALKETIRYVDGILRDGSTKHV